MAAAENTAGREAERALIIMGMLLVLAWMVAQSLVSEQLLGDPDTWWHIRTGGWIWDNAAVPTTDVFSHSFAGHPWIAKEWLSQLVFFGAFSLAGWNGVALAAILASALALAALHWSATRYLAPVPAALLALVFMFLASPTLIARPHLLSMLPLVIWTHQLFDASLRGRAPHFGWLAVIVLWANLHAAFTMGFVIAFFAFLDFLERTRLAKRDEFVKWIAFLALCPVVTLLHPYLHHAVLATFSVAGANEAVPFIDEWQPFEAPKMPLQAFALLGLMFLAVVNGFRLGIARALLIVLLLHLFLTHLRFAYILFPVTAILIAPAIARQFPRLSTEAWRAQARDRFERAALGNFKPLATAFALLIATAAAVQATVLRAAPPESVAASAAIAYAKTHGLSGNVWNAYGFGGPLIFHGIPTFVDGRTDQLFLGDFATSFLRGPDSEAPFAEALRRYDIRWTMLLPHDPRAAMLDQMAGWTRVFADGSAVIHQRREAHTQ